MVYNRTVIEAIVKQNRASTAPQEFLACIVTADLQENHTMTYQYRASSIFDGSHTALAILGADSDPTRVCMSLRGVHHFGLNTLLFCSDDRQL